MPDLPYIAAAQTTATAPTSYGTIGVCHLSESPAEPNNATNMFSVPTAVENYFADRHWKIPTHVTAKVVRAPDHGTLTSDRVGLFTYRPQPGYLGSDRISILADIEGKTLRMEYFVRVMTYVPADDKEPDVYARGYCPVPVRVWTIRPLQTRRAMR